MGSAADQELTEEDEDKLCNIKQEAMSAFADGNYEKAAGHFTEAIKMNSSSALMFAKRANWYGKLSNCSTGISAMFVKITIFVASFI